MRIIMAAVRKISCGLLNKRPTPAVHPSPWFLIVYWTFVGFTQPEITQQTVQYMVSNNEIFLKGSF